VSLGDAATYVAQGRVCGQFHFQCPALMIEHGYRIQSDSFVAMTLCCMDMQLSASDAAGCLVDGMVMRLALRPGLGRSTLDPPPIRIPLTSLKHLLAVAADRTLDVSFVACPLIQVCSRR